MNSIIEQNEKSYQRTICDFCKKDMIVTEGSVIVGVKWYHPVCFARADLDIYKTVYKNDQSVINVRAKTIPNASEGGTN